MAALPATEARPASVSLKAATLQDTAFGLLYGLLCTTYILYWSQGRTPTFLPTMSNTWDTAPGSWLSRFTIPFIALALAGFATCVYARNTALRDESTVRSGRFQFSDSYQFVVAIIGCLGFCGVAAVEDNEDNNLHLMFAVTTFVALDLYAVQISVYSPTSDSLKARSPLWVLEAACICASVLCKVRFCPCLLDASGLGGALWVGAIFEWVDVTSLAIFFGAFAHRRCDNVAVSVGAAVSP